MAEELKHGTVLPDPAVPAGPGKATHYAEYGVGGYHTGYADVAARDAISVERRQWWMVVVTQAGEKYELVPGHSSLNLADNGNWRVEVAPVVPTPGGGAGQRGTYLSLPGRYSAVNRVFDLPAGTVDVDLKWGSGRALEQGLDYSLAIEATPATVTIIADLAFYEGERIWGRTYRTPLRTYLSMPARYAANYGALVLAAGTVDVTVYWGSGRELEPGQDYTYDVPTRTLSFLADATFYAGERLWLWLYS